MPRPPRADLRPEILLNDYSEAEQQLAPLRRRGYRISIYSDEDRLKDSYFVMFGLLDRIIEDYRRNRGPREPHLDEGLMRFMMNRCQGAAARLVRDSEGALCKDGKLVHRLVSVGCRIQMTQELIAKARGCSISHVKQQIALLWKLGIIVNSGHGWYEFSADLCWRGKFELRSAYLKVQPQGEPVLILTDPPDDVPAVSAPVRPRQRSTQRAPSQIEAHEPESVPSAAA